LKSGKIIEKEGYLISVKGYEVGERKFIHDIFINNEVK
jgi:hypothetical protein